MIAEDFYKAWKKIQLKGLEVNLDFDLELHKKLIQMLYLGKSYYWMCDYNNNVYNISDECKNITGFKPEELTLDFFITRIHPEDAPYFLKFEQTAVEFFYAISSDKVFNYKVTYDLRFKTKWGKYIRIMQQVLPISTTPEGGVIRSFGIHTDISDYKQNGIPSLSFIGLNGEESQYNVFGDDTNDKAANLVTKREKEIILLLIDGMKTNEIAAKLFLSVYTVQNHRKNILLKTQSSSTSELISKAIKEGWV